MNEYKINTYFLYSPMTAGCNGGLGSMVMDNIALKCDLHYCSILMVLQTQALKLIKILI
jgi:hypothetical protein